MLSPFLGDLFKHKTTLLQDLVELALCYPSVTSFNSNGSLKKVTKENSKWIASSSDLYTFSNSNLRMLLNSKLKVASAPNGQHSDKYSAGNVLIDSETCYCSGHVVVANVFIQATSVGTGFGVTKDGLVGVTSFVVRGPLKQYFFLIFYSGE